MRDDRGIDQKLDRNGPVAIEVERHEIMSHQIWGGKHTLPTRKFEEVGALRDFAAR